MGGVAIGLNFGTLTVPIHDDFAASVWVHFYERDRLMANENDKTSGGAGGQPQASLADLQRTTDEITRMVRELRSTQVASRTMSMLGIIVLLAIMLSWGWFTYAKMRENFTQEKLQEAAVARAKIMLPQMQDQLRATLHDVLPFYLKMGRERLSAVRPKLESSLKVETDKLGAAIRTSMNQQIDQRFEKIATRASDQLATQFPALAGDAGRHAADRLKQDMVDRGGKLRDRINTMATEELTKVQGVLDKFPCARRQPEQFRSTGAAISSQPDHVRRL